MYGFEEFEFQLSMENVLKRVSDIVLWRHYLGVDFRIGKSMCAPYRTDKKASFSIFYSTSGKLMFKDFGGAGSYGDIINYIQMTEGVDFWGALGKINKDFRLGLGQDREFHKQAKPVQLELIKFEKDFIYTKGNVPLFQISIRESSREDVKFWSDSGITGGTLGKYCVLNVNNLYINKRLAYSYDPQNPCYAYYFSKTGHMKCYFPFSKVRRFMGNVNNYEDVQGYYQCDVKGDRACKLLLLTKSMKDCMLLRELGYDAMAINGESHYFHVDFIRHIKKYYKMIYSLYDPDKTGITGARYLWIEHRIPCVFIPRRYRDKCKDISDICKMHSKEEAEKVMKELLTGVF